MLSENEMLARKRFRNILKRLGTSMQGRLRTSDFEVDLALPGCFHMHLFEYVIDFNVC